MYFAKVWTVSQGLQITVKWTYDACGPLMHLMHLRTLIGSLVTLNRFSFYIWNDNRSVSKSVKKMLDHPLVTFHILLQDPMMFPRSNDPAQKISAQQNIFNFPFGNFSIKHKKVFKEWLTVFEKPWNIENLYFLKDAHVKRIWTVVYIVHCWTSAFISSSYFHLKYEINKKCRPGVSKCSVQCGHRVPNWSELRVWGEFAIKPKLRISSRPLFSVSRLPP